MTFDDDSVVAVVVSGSFVDEKRRHWRVADDDDGAKAPTEIRDRNVSDEIIIMTKTDCNSHWLNLYGILLLSLYTREINT